MSASWADAWMGPPKVKQQPAPPEPGGPREVHRAAVLKRAGRTVKAALQARNLTMAELSAQLGHRPNYVSSLLKRPYISVGKLADMAFELGGELRIEIRVDDGPGGRRGSRPEREPVDS